MSQLRFSIACALRGVATAIALVLSTAVLAADASRPNIIFLYADDIGYGDIGVLWQNQIRSGPSFATPALDALATDGAILTAHYTSAPVCAPARASLLQGRHQGHADARDSEFDHPLPDTINIANVLQAAGYATIYVGKHGLAGAESAVDLAGEGSRNLPAHPLHRNWDRFFGYLFHQDGHEHYPNNGQTDKSAYLFDDYRRITDASTDVYTTDVFTAFAKQAIIDEVDDGDDQPFLLFLGYDVPHFKMQRPAAPYPEGLGLNGGVQWTTERDSQNRVRYVNTATGAGTPDSYTHPSINPSFSTPQKQFVGMIERMDTSIADIRQLLVDLGISDNTLIVFSSDNGPHGEDGQNPRTFQSYADFQGMKRDVLEGGLRVPTFATWPERIPAGTIVDNASAIWDWLPTFAEAAHLPKPAWADGISLLPHLTGQGEAQHRDYLYFEFQPRWQNRIPNWSAFPTFRNRVRGEQQAISWGPFMGIRLDARSANDPFELYDVVNDPQQLTNVASAHPEIVSRMRDLALQLRRPDPTNDRAYLDTSLVPSVDEDNPWDVPLPSLMAHTISLHREGQPPTPWLPDLSAFEWLEESPSVSQPGDPHPILNPADGDAIYLYGHLVAPTSGLYTIHLATEGRAHLFLHDAHIIDADYNYSGGEIWAQVRLEAGSHPLKIMSQYRGDGAHEPFDPEDVLSWPIMPSIQWTRPDGIRETIPLAALRGPTPLRDWHGRQFQAEPHAWIADHDLDGIPRLIEYALGTNPQHHDDQSILWTASGLQNESLYVDIELIRESRSGLSYSLEQSFDLETWVPADADDHYELPFFGNAYSPRIHRWVLPNEPQNRALYLRLRVSIAAH